MERRYDIDWIRVLTIGLLLIYHITIIFQPWGVFIGFIQSEKPIGWIWPPMSMLNVWRIPLLFFVSGMGVYFALRKRNWKQLLKERATRIFVPLIAGMILIVPVHILLFQKYYHQDIAYKVNPAHLWFLANIFAYVLILIPVFILLKKHEESWFAKKMKYLFGSVRGWLIICGAFVLEVLMLKPEIYEMYAMTLHGFVLGLLAFFFGFICIYSGPKFTQLTLRHRWVFLLVALALYLFRLIFFELKAPNYLMTIETVTWIYAVFGFAYRYLNKPGKTLQYLSQGAYPIYIIHMAIQFLGAYLILPLDIPVLVKLVLLIVTTFAGSLMLYEFVIRRIGFLRPLFGLKSK